MTFLKKYANVFDEHSYANTLRKKRFAVFFAILENQINTKIHSAGLSKTITILDIGGTYNYWKQMGMDQIVQRYKSTIDIRVILLNIQEEKQEQFPRYISHMQQNVLLVKKRIPNVDILFSNSVIEHVGNVNKQQQFTQYIRSYNKPYYVQTPNKYFIIEPHTLVPGFALLPVRIKVWLVQQMSLGWIAKQKSKRRAEKTIQQLQLLTKKEFSQLFFDAQIDTEKWCGLAKSFIAIKE
jgi:hypothetical protein